MKTFKDFFGILLIAYLALSVTIFKHIPENLLPFHIGLISIIALLLFFNIFTRNLYFFKGYFVSEWNIFSEKSTRSFKSDLPIDLIRENLNDIFTKHHFKIRHQDSSCIFATTGMTFRSWGENIYCDIQTKGEQVEIQITSVCLFQHYSWGKNDQNLSQLISSFEASLTV